MGNQCYTPTTLYKSKMGPNPATGKWPLVGKSMGLLEEPVPVPCGRCIGCRLERSRQNAIRCMHESELHQENSFITLTYRDQDLVLGDNETPTLHPRDLQLFLKRLRKAYGPGIKFFACGEYGSTTRRPHYHACLFGWDPPDKELYSVHRDNQIFSSTILDNLWTHGDTKVGALTFESAAYVARYVMDKKLGRAAKYYETNGLHPEFVRMSRRPGIGSAWYDKYESDCFPHDFCVIRGGVKTKPPKYYSNKYELKNPQKYAIIKEARKKMAEKNASDNTKSRLKVKQEVKKAQIKSLQKNQL